MESTLAPPQLETATAGENPAEDRVSLGSAPGLLPVVRPPWRRRLAFWEAALFAVVFSLLTLFVVAYVSRERLIYFWDYVGYHNLYNDLGTRFQLGPLIALRSVFYSVRGSDYNSLPTLFLMPFRLAFGPGRLGYILAITITFVFPSIVLFSRLVRNLTGRVVTQSTFDEAGLTLLSILSVALLPLLWIPVLLGSVDAGGLILIFIVLMLYFRVDFVEQKLGSVLSMALLLSLLVLCRRWYAYWVIGFFGALVVCEGLKCAWDRERRVHRVLLAKNALTLGGVSFLSFFLIATPTAWKMLTTDYQDVYSAYRSRHPIFHNLEMLYDHMGLLTFAFVGLGIVLSARNKMRRPIVNFLCVQFAITFVLFTRTQDFGFQHFYGVLATLALFLAFFTQDVFMWLKTRPGKIAALFLLLIATLAAFTVTFLPSTGGLLKPVSFALPQARQYPKVRTDLKEVQALLNTLSDISKDSESTIYILSSSFSLNSSIVHEACFTLETPHRSLARKIAATNDVDKRDGFPIQFLKARYVVLTIPFGYHLAPQDQRVIGVLAEQIATGEGMGKSYDKLNFEFSLEDGSSAFIYRKDRPLDPSAIKSLSDFFVELYPANRDKFQIPSDVIREVSVL